jgi:multidrug efflux pump
MTSEWTELSFLQKQSSKVEQFRDLRQNPFSAFVLGAVLVFFVQAGLYESWSLPQAVILVVPMCVLSALAGIALAQMDVNIFVQVGFVVLVGLACKNAILIVEFARDREEEGASRFEAAVEAARVRLRPIIMTSFAFILGVLPLVIAQGAGAEMRRTLGTAVFAGMIGVTLFGIFLTPVFYSVVRWFSGRGLATPESAPAHGSPDGARTVPGDAPCKLNPNGVTIELAQILPRSVAQTSKSIATPNVAIIAPPASIPLMLIIDELWTFIKKNRNTFKRVIPMI